MRIPPKGQVAGSNPAEVATSDKITLARAQIKYHYDTTSLNTSPVSSECVGRCLPLHAKLRSAPKHTRDSELVSKHTVLGVLIWVFRGHFEYLRGFTAVTLPFTFLLFLSLQCCISDDFTHPKGG